MTRPSILSVTVTSSPVTWPEHRSEASTTTCAATSSSTATLRGGIVLVIRRTSPSEAPVMTTFRPARPVSTTRLKAVDGSDELMR